MIAISPSDRAHPKAWFKQEDGVLKAGGHWTVAEAPTLDAELSRLDTARLHAIDARQVEKLDSAGAWLLLRTRRALGTDEAALTVPPLYRPLMEAVGAAKGPPPPPARRNALVTWLEHIGRATVAASWQAYGMLGYLGQVTVEAGRAVRTPKSNSRLTATVRQIQETGLNALPIVGLLSFLIGIVVAYQGADQLKQFGAQVFTINLLGVGVLRELGGLITAIVVAGRSGSAFTAQIGAMRVNEEIDAMRTIGLNTVEVLVLPRIIGLVIALPLLTFYSDILGLIGGAVMCYFQLDITIHVFLRQLGSAVGLNTFLVGLSKAPVFAFAIALIGCYEGFQVQRNAASVGRLTTRSVVESVFLVIVLDAAFSVLFSMLGV